MKDTNPIEDLQQIRKLMEGSTKFLSLSGLSGVVAGTIALIGAFVGHLIIEAYATDMTIAIQIGDLAISKLDFYLFILAFTVLALALFSVFFFTYLKAKKRGEQLLNSLSIKLFLSVFVPLAFSGIFVIGLYLRGYEELSGPVLLFLYGLSILNGSKYVHAEVKYMALSEMFLGLVLLFLPKGDIWFLAIGFGGLHILYGALMYFKYEHKQ